ncbi:uncharacterized protein OCT59_000682 [Rhizophagus irregularis]|uniref:uncharacterized protein n=1 Tax=Rhizophagus irregularis TaxID=588596 RepID=UPI003331FD88|nr:hypothetical protein OCT59_000682 [Rhizophagus irregularis]
MWIPESHREISSNLDTGILQGNQLQFGYWNPAGKLAPIWIPESCRKSGLRFGHGIGSNLPSYRKIGSDVNTEFQVPEYQSAGLGLYFEGGQFFDIWMTHQKLGEKGAQPLCLLTRAYGNINGNMASFLEYLDVQDSI